MSAPWWWFAGVFVVSFAGTFVALMVLEVGASGLWQVPGRLWQRIKEQP